MKYAVIFAVSLAMTEALELGLAAALRIRVRADYRLIFLMNIVTNPAVVLIYYTASRYTSAAPLLIKLPLEVAAILAEAFFLGRYGRGIKRPLLFSAALNGFSFIAGEIIGAIF